MPSMWTSRTRQPGPADRAELRYSWAEANVSTWYPADPTSRRSARRTDRSSSTMEITQEPRGYHPPGTGQPDELSERAGPHLLHDTGAVHLDRLLRDAELGPDLLVQHPGHHEREDLRFAWGQRRNAILHLRDSALFSLFFERPGHRLRDGGQERSLVQWLRQEVDRPALHRLDAGPDVTVAADEDDREPPPRRTERLLQIESGPARHAHVQQQTGGTFLGRPVEKIAHGGERLGIVAGGPDQPRQTLPHRRVIVHHEHHRARWSHHGPSWPAGSTNENVAPSAGLFRASTRPPCASTMDFTMASPIPRPLAFVV